eukprot:PhF_6_TR42806/c0_g1_i1/m.64799
MVILNSFFSILVLWGLVGGTAPNCNQPPSPSSPTAATLPRIILTRFDQLYSLLSQPCAASPSPLQILLSSSTNNTDDGVQDQANNNTRSNNVASGTILIQRSAVVQCDDTFPVIDCGLLCFNMTSSTSLSAVELTLRGCQFFGPLIKIDCSKCNVSVESVEVNGRGMPYAL